MFLTVIVLSAIAFALFKLGALSVWVAVLSMAFKAPGVRQFARKNAEFCPLFNVAMRVCGVIFAKVVWGHA